MLPRASNVREAQTIAHSEAMRRFGRLRLNALEAGVVGDLEAFKRNANRAMLSAITLGLRLIALKERLPHGEFIPKCQALGLSQPTAWRFMRLAEICPILPASPPDGVSGPWSIDKALSYAKEAEAAIGVAALASDPLPAGEVRKAAAQRMAARKQAASMRSLMSRILRLETEVAVALHDDEAQVLSALHTFVQAAQRLQAMANQLHS